MVNFKFFSHSCYEYKNNDYGLFTKNFQRPQSKIRRKNLKVKRSYNYIFIFTSETKESTTASEKRVKQSS